MATGASTADLAIILIDARNGVLPQSRRHAFIANLLGIKHFVVAINKMDLVGFDKAVYDAIRTEFTGFLSHIGAPAPCSFRSARAMAITWSRRACAFPGTRGPAFSNISRPFLTKKCRCAVDCLSSTSFVRKTIAGLRWSDCLRRRHCRRYAVSSTPRRQVQVAAIPSYSRELSEAFAPSSVSLCLNDHVDLGEAISWPIVITHLRKLAASVPVSCGCPRRRLS